MVGFEKIMMIVVMVKAIWWCCIGGNNTCHVVVMVTWLEMNAMPISDEVVGGGEVF